MFISLLDNLYFSIIAVCLLSCFLFSFIYDLFTHSRPTARQPRKK